MTIAGIEPDDELSYAGFTFDGTYNLAVSVEPVKDDAKRVIVYHEHTITVKAVVVPDGNDSSTDDAMLNLRRRLGASGGSLVFKNRGFGADIEINKGRVKDVKFGPHPKVISWEPTGDNKAATIEWQVVARFPVCDAARFKGVLALNYDIGIAIDDKSNSTRTITGYIEIAQTRKLATTSPRDIADNYRKRFTVAPLPGFKRNQTWNTTADKSRLNFSIVDRQINSKNPYPQFCTEISATHNVAMSRAGKGGFNASVNTLSADIELIPGKSGAVAWLIFLQLIQSRIFTARGSKQVVLLQNLNISEDIFGRASRFSVSYRMLHCLKDFVERTGIWKPLGTNWERWATSVSPMFGKRGNAGLQAFANQDALISLCLSDLDVAIDSPLRTEQQVADKLPSLENLTPPPKRSWLEYKNIVQIFEDRPVITQSVIQEGAPEPKKQTALGTEDFSIVEASSSVIAPIFQAAGAPLYFARMIGHAARAGHKIPQPRLDKVGDAKTKQITSNFTPGALSNMFGVPVFGAAWEIIYALSGAPGPVPPEDNLKECIDGKKGTAAKPGKTGSLSKL